MKKGVLIVALSLVSFLALNSTVFMAFASEPNVLITPTHGSPGESFDFVITATSWSTVSGIEVEDPEGKTWKLLGWSNGEWRSVTILLKDAGDSVQITWTDASYSLNGDVKLQTLWGPVSVLKWVNGEDPPHTQLMGAYSLSFSGWGCHYFFVDSFFVVPETPLGTVSILLTCLAGLAMYTRGGRFTKII